VRLREFRLLADENIHPEVVAWLRANGFDVKTCVDAAVLGSDDGQVLRFASAEQRVVLTHDRDFGELAIARRETLVGIVYLRPGHIRASFTIDSLNALLRIDPDLDAPFIVVVQRDGLEVRMRVRNL